MRKTFPLLLTMMLSVSAFAGEGVSMKCGAAAAGEKTDKGCGYEEMVTFGGGMRFEQITGYCRACKKFVHVRWTRDGIPESLRPPGGPKEKPEPLGEIWDASTGATHTVHACPGCEGPFVEIKGPKDLTHCPKCNEPHFGIDPDKPRLAID